MLNSNKKKSIVFLFFSFAHLFIFSVHYYMLKQFNVSTFVICFIYFSNLLLYRYVYPPDVVSRYCDNDCKNCNFYFCEREYKEKRNEK